MTELPPVYTYAEAAVKLGKNESWLRRHIRSLPHYRIGQTALFSDEHIAAIRKANEVIPAAMKPPQPMRPLTRRRREW